MPLHDAAAVHKANQRLWRAHIRRINPPVGTVERIIAPLAREDTGLGRKFSRALVSRAIKRNKAFFQTVLDELPQGALCIDLGANVGNVSAGLLARGFRVMAYEADPATFAMMDGKLAGTPGYQGFNAAVGDRDGEIVLRRERGWAEGDLERSLGASVAFADATMDAATEIPVEMVDIAQVILGLEEEPALLMMDIEGAEWDVLPRLIKTGAIDRFRYVFAETHEWRDPSKQQAADKMRAYAETVERPQIFLNWE